MLYLTSTVLGAALCCFAYLGLRARWVDGPLDDYITARNSQTASTLGLSFLASGMGAWILFAPPEIGAFVGPLALAGYALGSALPFIVLGLYGPKIRRALPEGRSIAEFAEACYGQGVRRWGNPGIGRLYGLLPGRGVDRYWRDNRATLGCTARTSNYRGRLDHAGLYGGGGLRASLATDRWQAWLLLALLLAVTSVTLWRMPVMPSDITLPSIPVTNALSVALTLVIAVTAANLFHQGYWQRVWAARDEQSLGRGAWLGGAMTVAVVMLIGGLGMVAAMSGIPLGEPPMPFFALLNDAPVWLTLPALVLAVTLVASSVDTLQNGIASLVVARSEQRGVSLNAARWVTIAVMVPVVVIALQGVSVLRLFLIADLLCAAIVVPVLLGLWPRMTPAAAIAGGLAGLLGAIIPGWISQGTPVAGIVVASFPGGIPTLGPFVGALAASTLVSLLLARYGRRVQPT